jgi:hypothetical protein
MDKTKATRIAAKKVENVETALKEEMKMTLSNLQANSNLWYKVSKVLFLI